MTLTAHCKNLMAHGRIFAADVAYHLDKLERTGGPLINILGRIMGVM